MHTCQEVALLPRSGGIHLYCKMPRLVNDGSTFWLQKLAPIVSNIFSINRIHEVIEFVRVNVTCALQDRYLCLKYLDFCVAKVYVCLDRTRGPLMCR